MDQIHVLFHDLNSDWSIINCVAYFFNEETLSPSDYQLYEGMFSRTKANLQSTFAQLLVLLPQIEFLIDITRLIDQLEIQNLLLVVAELKPLVNRLQQLVKEVSRS